MKTRTLGVVAALIASATLASANEVKWNTDLTKAMKLAKKQKKAIMIDFFTEW